MLQQTPEEPDMIAETAEALGSIKSIHDISSVLTKAVDVRCLEEMSAQ